MNGNKKSITGILRLVDADPSLMNKIFDACLKHKKWDAVRQLIPRGATYDCFSLGKIDELPEDIYKDLVKDRLQVRCKPEISRDEITLLHGSAHHSITTKRLLKLGIDVNIESKYGKTPYEWFLLHEDVKGALILLRHGATYPSYRRLESIVAWLYYTDSVFANRIDYKPLAIPLQKQYIEPRMNVLQFCFIQETTHPSWLPKEILVKILEHSC